MLVERATRTLVLARLAYSRVAVRFFRSLADTSRLTKGFNKIDN